MKIYEYSGIDGSGKTTALNHVYEELIRLGVRVEKTREVGAPQIPESMALRELVLNKNNKMSPEAMEAAFLSMAVMKEDWLASLKGIDVVLVDRGYLCHAAYGAASCSNWEFMRTLLMVYQKISHRKALPVYFDITLETSKARRNHRGLGGDKIEDQGDAFFSKVLSAYESNIRLNPHIKIDANQDLNGVKSQLNTLLIPKILEDIGNDLP